jgi:hypothetical protein
VGDPHLPRDVRHPRAFQALPCEDAQARLQELL